MQFGKMAFAFVLLVSAFGLGHALEMGSCADGTPYGKCSTKNPGHYCTGSPPALQLYTNLCKCEAVPGWITQGTGEQANCVQAKCDDGTMSGSCTPNKPKVCIGGSVYADNASKCGCPPNKKVSANGIFCESIPCKDGEFTVEEGTCSPKKAKKCVDGALVDKASECGCPAGQTRIGESCAVVCSDGTKEGECSASKPKECLNGYLVDNAAKCGCPEGKAAHGKYCADSAVSGAAGSELLGSAGSAEGADEESRGISPISCCCLPTALIGIAGAFALSRRG
ncbi:MAG: hypothetical protein N3F07_02205 [Candidatus Micrarchaeota archaeon]|nr:hypothetical protein [Candidatus Micrarchaeota archaeon]